MKLYSLAGHIALGSRLRRLSEILSSDAEQIYALYDSDIHYRWFPVFFMLTKKGEAAVNELADDVGQSHAAVSQVVRDMIKNDVVETQKCKHDGRVSKVSLTAKGKELAVKLEKQSNDVDVAVQQILSQSGSNIWSEIELFEHELNTKSLYQRVYDIKKARESDSIKITPYEARFQSAFKALNQAWIEQYWEMEASDFQSLDAPKQHIIDQGGYIAFALKGNDVVGTCALINNGNGEYELAKMAVKDGMKGLGIGEKLGQHIIDEAKSMGAKTVYLESNTQLTPALNLYRKLGFKKTTLKKPSPYHRCNIQMELTL